MNNILLYKTIIIAVIKLAESHIIHPEDAQLFTWQTLESLSETMYEDESDIFINLAKDMLNEMQKRESEKTVKNIMDDIGWN